MWPPPGVDVSEVSRCQPPRGAFIGALLRAAGRCGNEKWLGNGWETVGKWLGNGWEMMGFIFIDFVETW